MIKIIEEGSHIFQNTCTYCGTIISYHIKDLERTASPYVKCPICGEHIYHAYKEKTPLVQEDNNNEKKEI